MTTTEIESFHAGGAKAGALIRHLSEDLLQTTLAFRVNGGPVVHLFQGSTGEVGLARRNVLRHHCY